MQTTADTLDYHFGLETLPTNNLAPTSITTASLPNTPTPSLPVVSSPVEAKAPLRFSEEELLSKKASIKIPEPFVPKRNPPAELTVEERTARAFSKRSQNGLIVSLNERTPIAVPGVSGEFHSPQHLPALVPHVQSRAPRTENFAARQLATTFRVAGTVLIITFVMALALQSWTYAQKNTPMYMKQAGDLAVSCGASSIALKIFNENLRDPKNVNVLVEWGDKFRSNKNYQDANEFYNQAIKLNPDFPLAYLNRGANFLDMGQNQKALADANQAIKLNPDYAMAYNNRGCTYVAMNKLPLAAVDFSKAIALEPHTVRYWVNRGNCYLEMKQYKQAIPNYDYAIAHGSEPAIALRAQAQKALTSAPTTHSKKHRAHKTTT